jgi:hypothetical protein
MTSHAPARHMKTALPTSVGAHFLLFSVHDRVFAVVLVVGIAVASAARRRVMIGRVSFMVAWLIGVWMVCKVRGVLWRWFVVRGLGV